MREIRFLFNQTIYYGGVHTYLVFYEFQVNRMRNMGWVSLERQYALVGHDFTATDKPIHDYKKVFRKRLDISGVEL